MNYIFEGFVSAFSLLLRFDADVFSAAWTSLKVSSIAVCFATIVSVPLGVLIATRDFKGKTAVILVLNTLISLPTVVVGLVIYAMLSRHGPLGVLGLLYTPWAMVIGQFILSTPIITSLVLSAVKGIDEAYWKTAFSLGAGRLRASLTVLDEARYAVVAAVVAGFGRIIGEVGCAMMVGGNIRGFTRTMSTAIALETGKGEFGLGIALGIILLGIAFLVNVLLFLLQSRGAQSAL